MLFSSTTFVYLFLPIIISVYYIFLRKFRKLQNVFLTLASLFFYAWGEPKFVVVMLCSIIINWLMGLGVAKYKELGNPKVVRIIVLLSIVANVALLFVFKYLTFTCSIISDLLGISMTIPKIALPIGISFFTFQAMSYVIDVYRDKGKVQTNILNVALYISFFPQLIAGPIVRYETVAYEIENREETLDEFLDGFARFVVGFSKKVLISNNLSIVADQAFAFGDELTFAYSWLGAICYTLQIYFDFSGYSDMAIGLGRMFGFHFLENFNHPYISCSVSEFWRRWHISLGSWFRDYIYIPLGGSYVKPLQNILNLFVVWTLTGIWHGANWTFLLWGEMYFVLLVIEKLTKFDKKERIGIGRVCSWLYTMVFVVFGWVIFRADSVSHAFAYIKTMLRISNNEIYNVTFLSDFKNIWVWLFAGIILSAPIGNFIKKKEKLDSPVFQIIYRIILILLFVLSLASIVSSSHNPFIYFNF